MSTAKPLLNIKTAEIAGGRYACSQSINTHPIPPLLTVPSAYRTLSYQAKCLLPYDPFHQVSYITGIAVIPRTVAAVRYDMVAEFPAGLITQTFSLFKHLQCNFKQFLRCVIGKLHMNGKRDFNPGLLRINASISSQYPARITQIIAVVLQVLDQRSDGFPAEILVSPLSQGIGFVNEEDSSRKLLICSRVFERYVRCILRPDLLSLPPAGVPRLKAQFLKQLPQDSGTVVFPVPGLPLKTICRTIGSDFMFLFSPFSQYQGVG